MICEQTGAKVVPVPITDACEIDLEAMQRLLNPRTRMVAVAHISNAIGTVHPVKEIIKLAHDQKIPVLIDAAHSIAHDSINVQEWDCDFLVGSGHKCYGPTGIGYVYAKSSMWEVLPPYQGGGSMIERVSFERVTFRDFPERYEAGTPHIAGAIALGAAIDFINQFRMDDIVAHEQSLLDYAINQFSQMDEIKLLGSPKKRSCGFSFLVKNIHPHDIATSLNQDGIAIRAGHHCCQPLMKRLGVPGTNRVSFAIYNTKEEIDILVASLKKILKIFA